MKTLITTGLIIIFAVTVNAESALNKRFNQQREEIKNENNRLIGASVSEEGMPQLTMNVGTIPMFLRALRESPGGTVVDLIRDLVPRLAVLGGLIYGVDQLNSSGGGGGGQTVGADPNSPESQRKASFAASGQGQGGTGGDSGNFTQINNVGDGDITINQTEQ